MAFPTPAVIGGGIQMAGGIIGSAVSARQAAKQRSFQKWMMKNRYQLQMQDMREAGLNPILAAGASPPSPAGAAASVGNPAAGVVASAKDAMRAKSEVGLLRRQNELAEAQTKNQKQQEAYMKNHAEAEAYNIDASEHNASRAMFEAASARERLRMDQIRGNVYGHPAYEAKLWVDEGLKTVNSAANVATGGLWSLFRRGGKLPPGGGVFRRGGRSPKPLNRTPIWENVPYSPVNR